jgi:hypothetical protein
LWSMEIVFIHWGPRFEKKNTNLLSLCKIVHQNLQSHLNIESYYLLNSDIHYLLGLFLMASSLQMHN